LKRTLAALVFLVLIIVFILVSANVSSASAQIEGYTIQNVEHQVELLYSANVVIRETITLAGEATDAFVMGFPYRYSGYILKGAAFDQSGPLQMNMGVQLGNRSGFYGVEIALSQNSPQKFSVVFILSNKLISKVTSGYSLDFPAYPSFSKEVASCNVALVLPGEATSVSISKPDGAINATSFAREPLAAFTNSPATVTFSVPAGALQPLDITSLNRVVTIYPAGEIRATDSYRITNMSPESMSTVQLGLPRSAFNVVGKDSLGRTLSVNVNEGGDPVTSTTLTLQNPIGEGQTAVITTEYSLPNALQGQNTRFAFDLDLFPVINCFVEDGSLLIVPPEGAHFTTPQVSALDTTFSVFRELFQETLGIQRSGVSYVDRNGFSETKFQVALDYNPIWLSLRPTLGVWALAIVGSILLSVWRRPKSPNLKRSVVPRLSAGLSPDNVRAFIEAYEERRGITHELRVLHARGQKGKIPRNYYKSQRKNLETRLNALSKNINQLKDTFRNAGGKYGDLIRQLDLSENELAKSRARIREAEGRHKTGEMKIDEYKKALGDYQLQKEKLEQQTNGILLRLREEIH